MKYTLFYELRSGKIRTLVKHAEVSLIHKYEMGSPKNDLPCFVTIFLDCHYFLYLIFYGVLWGFVKGVHF